MLFVSLFIDLDSKVQRRSVRSITSKWEIIPQQNIAARDCGSLGSAAVQIQSLTSGLDSCAVSFVYVLREFLSDSSEQALTHLLTGHKYSIALHWIYYLQCFRLLGAWTFSCSIHFLS